MVLYVDTGYWLKNRSESWDWHPIQEIIYAQISLTSISAKCENKHSGCVEWAANGQCFKTPPFMLMNCWKSCSFCGKPDIYLYVYVCSCTCSCYFLSILPLIAVCQQLRYTLIEIDEHLLILAPCVDKHPNKCPLWAKYGECKKNKTFMEENCWKSCSKCKLALYVS